MRTLPQWAPRVLPAIIRRLYQLDAQGILDFELIDEVAYSFYARCESILTVTRAEHGTVTCPTCGGDITRVLGDKEEELRCGGCGWELTWGEYLATYQHKQLSGGSALPAFTEYVRRLPAAQTPRERMLLIDWLLHEVHKSWFEGTEGKCWYGRAAAVNLVEATHTQVIQLLQELAYGPGSTPEVRSEAEAWRREVLPRLSWPEGGMPRRRPPRQDRHGGGS